MQKYVFLKPKYRKQLNEVFHEIFIKISNNILKVGFILSRYFTPTLTATQNCINSMLKVWVGVGLFSNLLAN